MSETLTKIIVDCSTGVVAEIPLTGEEIAQREADAAKAESDRIAQEAENAAKAEQKAELLAKLGITEDEAKLLLG
jgi:pyruvate/oxaloacetate carboxyltransferase